MSRAPLTDEVIASRLAATAARVERELERSGRRRPGPACALEPPPSFLAMLQRAVAVEAEHSADRAWQLEQLYLDTLPTLRVQQACDASAPIGPLFHTPLRWSELPALCGAIARLFARVAAAGLVVDDVLGASSPEALLAAHPTLDALCARTHYGGFLPLLYAYPNDLARGGRLLAAGDSIESVVDRLFTAPIIHELCHFARHRTVEVPLYLDEAIAAYLGVSVLPAMAFPDETGAHGLYGAYLLYQVGQWLARLVGGDALVAMQSGAVSAATVFGAERLRAIDDFGWQDYLARRPLHLLSDNYDPQRWCRVVAGLAPDASWSGMPLTQPCDADFELLDAGLRAMCLVEEEHEGTFVVRRAACATPVTVDAEAAVIRGGPRLFGHHASYLLAPALAAALGKRGHRAVELASLSAAAIPAEVERIRALVLP